MTLKETEDFIYRCEESLITVPDNVIFEIEDFDTILKMYCPELWGREFPKKLTYVMRNGFHLKVTSNKL